MLLFWTHFVNNRALIDKGISLGADAGISVGAAIMQAAEKALFQSNNLPDGTEVEPPDLDSKNKPPKIK